MQSDAIACDHATCDGMMQSIMMRKSRSDLLLAWLLALGTQAGAAATFDGPEYSRAKASGPQGDTRVSIAQLPDFNGAWGLSRESFGIVVKTSDTIGAGRIPPFTPRFAAMHDVSVRQRRGGESAGNNSAACLPNGMPSIMSAALAFEFLMTPGRVTIVPENNEVRRVHTDGRVHPDEPDPAWEGHSIGHWENGTLVIDTVGMNGRSEMFVGMRVTPRTRVVERVSRTDQTHVRIDTTVYNDEMFTRPYQYSRVFNYSAAGMMQAFCTENNRDNNITVDLTPPPE
jgi:hypothetical protein